MTLPSDTLARLRASGPLVHNVTNYVAMDVTANALLAVGASPLMAHALEEVDEIVGLSSAVAINIGTLDPAWVKAMHRVADRAASQAKPWVLDPVGAGATAYRTETSRDLARRRPAAIRGNASEILALAGATVVTKGVDSVHGSGEARDAAVALARELQCVVAVTGAVDYVTDGTRTLSITNGDPLMAKVTALGCTATALVAAGLAVSGSALHGAAHALAILGVCGELAAERAAGPGTLRLHLVDALHLLDGATLDTRARVEEI
jgi:hydroxyethylthiazole kinase